MGLPERSSYSDVPRSLCTLDSSLGQNYPGVGIGLARIHENDEDTHRSRDERSCVSGGENRPGERKYCPRLEIRRPRASFRRGFETPVPLATSQALESETGQPRVLTVGRPGSPAARSAGHLGREVRRPKEWAELRDGPANQDEAIDHAKDAARGCCGVPAGHGCHGSESAGLLLGWAPAILAHHPDLHASPCRPNPLPVPSTDFDVIWNKSVEVVDKYFDIASENRLSREIITQPKPGATLIEPWNRDSSHSPTAWNRRFRPSAASPSSRLNRAHRRLPREGRGEQGTGGYGETGPPGGRSSRVQ